MLSQIVGTLFLILLTSAIGVPIGILSGIYLWRASGGRFADLVRFVTDVIAGTPSIVAGGVTYALVVIPMGHFSALAGAVALALLMFPTVTRATEETIKLVPPAIREAGLALGLPEWKTTLRIVLPSATAGIVTAIMLGVARVAGETAPLVFTAFGNDHLVANPTREIGALPLQIWKYAQAPYDDWHRQAWAGAFVLFCLVVLINLIARVLTYRLSSRVGTG
jgi:phosphate transport system permease protein